MSNLRIFASAFLDGFSGAGLYQKLRRPGAPTQVFADPVPQALSVRTIHEERRPERLTLKPEGQEIAHIGR